MIVFNPTDFPCPVAPAIRICGIFVRSSDESLIGMVFPSTIGSSKVDFCEPFGSQQRLHRDGFRIFIGYFNPDSSFSRYGGDDPDTNAERLKAISSSRFLIFEIRIPASGTIS